MKNYQDSDYALNKHSGGIVYRFADRIAEITLEDYLSENPGRTEADFREWKALSDADYLEQDRTDYRQTWKNASIHGLEYDAGIGASSLEEAYIEASERKKAREAFSLLMKSGELTETQQRRFLLHTLGGLSTRQIADKEGRTQRAIVKSLHAAINKLNKYFFV